MPRIPFWRKAQRCPDRTFSATTESATPARPLDLATLEDRVLFSAGPLPIEGAAEEPVDTAAINAAPILNDTDVNLDSIFEDAGVPVGAVGTLISNLVDLTPDSQSVEREHAVPFYAAANGNNAQRNIGLWFDGWDEWATKVEVSLEKHGSLWMHLPYGRITPGQMDFDGRSDAAAGVPPHHGPLPHISDGLAHYLEQVVTPDDELFFYFGAPYQIYTDGMTYTEFETAVMAEFSDILTLADDAKVSIGFDNTFGRPASLGGIWSVLGGPTGYHAQLFQTVAAQGVNVILEPWIYKGATWAYSYDTVSAERFYRLHELHLGDEPKGANWENRSLLDNDHYRLPDEPDIVEYFGGSWEAAVKEILSVGEIPMGRFNDADSLFLPAWVEYADELTDPSTLVPLPGYDPPSSTSLQQNSFEGDLDTIAPFTGDPDFAALFSDSPSEESEVSPASVLDNVFDSDGLITGVAIVGADTSNGTWWYSIDGGGTWGALGTVSDNSARLLAANPLTRIYFQPDPEFSGNIADAITFQAWDRSDATANGTAGVDVSSGGGTSAFSTATDGASLTVTSVNDPPSISAIPNQLGTEDMLLGPVTLTVNDMESPLDSLVVTATSSDQTIVPESGIVISGTGANRSLTIAPGLHQFGAVVISVTVSDGTESTTENFAVSFAAVPDPPVAVDDSYTATEDQPLTVSPSGPLANDIDPDGDSLTSTIFSGPINGTLLSQPDGSFTYTPNPGFLGSDQFQYTASDGGFVSNVAIVQIFVQPNLAPPPPPLDPSFGRSPQFADSPFRDTASATPSAGIDVREVEDLQLQMAPTNFPANRGVRQLLLQSSESAELVVDAAPEGETQQQVAVTKTMEATETTEVSIPVVTDIIAPNVSEAVESEAMESTESREPELTGESTTPNESRSNPETVDHELDPNFETEELWTVLDTVPGDQDGSDVLEILATDIALGAGAALAIGCAIRAVRGG